MTKSASGSANTPIIHIPTVRVKNYMYKLPTELINDHRYLGFYTCVTECLKLHNAATSMISQMVYNQKVFQFLFLFHIVLIFVNNPLVSLVLGYGSLCPLL